MGLKVNKHNEIVCFTGLRKIFYYYYFLNAIPKTAWTFMKEAYISWDTIPEAHAILPVS